MSSVKHIDKVMHINVCYWHGAHFIDVKNEVRVVAIGITMVITISLSLLHVSLSVLHLESIECNVCT